MYVLCKYYVFFGAHVHSNVFRRPIRAQGLSWYSVKTQGPSQYTPQSAMSVVWKDPCSGKISRRIALVTEAFATSKDTIAFVLLFLVLFLFLCLLGGELLLLHSRLCFGWLFLPLLLHNERALPLHPLIVCRYPCPLVVASISAPRGCTTVCFRALASVRPLVPCSVSFSEVFWALASVRPLVPSSVSFSEVYTLPFSEVYTLSFLPAPLIRQKLSFLPALLIRQKH